MHIRFTARSEAADGGLQVWQLCITGRFWEIYDCVSGIAIRIGQDKGTLYPCSRRLPLSYPLLRRWCTSRGTAMSTTTTMLFPFHLKLLPGGEGWRSWNDFFGGVWLVWVCVWIHRSHSCEESLCREKLVPRGKIWGCNSGRLTAIWRGHSAMTGVDSNKERQCNGWRFFWIIDWDRWCGTFYLTTVT